MHKFNAYTFPLSVIEHDNIYQAKSLKLTSLNQWRSFFTQKDCSGSKNLSYCLIAELICDYFLALPQTTKTEGRRITLNTPWEPCDRVLLAEAAPQLHRVSYSNCSRWSNSCWKVFQIATRYGRCCSQCTQAANTDECIHLPDKTDPIRHPCFAQGYPKGGRFLCTSSPVVAVDLLSPSHPAVLLRVRVSLIWALWSLWCPEIPRSECLHMIWQPGARCGFLWVMWQARGPVKTRLRSGLP